MKYTNQQLAGMVNGAKVDKRDKIDEIYGEHKRLADERNILVLTASQTNREGLEKAHLSKKHIAEDIRILANTDMIIAVSQTPEMERSSQMRVFVMSGRSEQDNFGCLVSQNIPIGQVVVDSWWPNENEYT